MDKEKVANALEWDELGEHCYMVQSWNGVLIPALL